MGKRLFLVQQLLSFLGTTFACSEIFSAGDGYGLVRGLFVFGEDNHLTSSVPMFCTTHSHHIEINRKPYKSHKNTIWKLSVGVGRVGIGKCSCRWPTSLDWAPLTLCCRPHKRTESFALRGRDDWQEAVCPDRFALPHVHVRIFISGIVVLYLARNQCCAEQKATCYCRWEWES